MDQPPASSSPASAGAPKPRPFYARKSFSGPQFARPGERGSLLAYGGTTLEAPAHALEGPFALVDVETSALDPRDGRVLEIAILRLERDGTVSDEFVTLVDPQNGEVGPDWLHKITTDDVRGAPVFAQIADSVLERLAGAVVVAHNAAFEDRWLAAEFERLGRWPRGLPHLPALDTLWLARQVRSLPNYKLQTVVDAYGCTLDDAHTALGDVRALAQLLPRMLVDAGPLHYPVMPAPPQGGVMMPRLQPRPVQGH